MYLRQNYYPFSQLSYGECLLDTRSLNDTVIFYLHLKRHLGDRGFSLNCFSQVLIQTSVSIKNNPPFHSFNIFRTGIIPNLLSSKEVNLIFMSTEQSRFKATGVVGWEISRCSKIPNFIAPKQKYAMMEIMLRHALHATTCHDFQKLDA